MGLNKRLIGAGAVGSGALTPSENFKVVTYTGNSSTQAITGVGFQPDFVWIKPREDARHHYLFDSTRGTTEFLHSSTNEAVQTDTNSLTSFDTDGFTLGSSAGVNLDNKKHVAWCWKANGGTTSSNTDGSITSTVQTNDDAGFSIVKWSGNSSSGTVGHGLSQAPEFILIKNLDATYNWLVIETLNNSGGYLDLTDSFTTTRYNDWLNSSNPSSTTIPLGAYSYTNGTNMIMYCFHSVAGFSKFGSYTGTGGNLIVETGFEPAFLMIKRTDASNYDWYILDNKRNPVDYRNTILRANATTADQTVTNGDIDVKFLSNGFAFDDIPTTSAGFNASGGTYLYMAFAADADTEAPTLADSFNIETYTGNGGTQTISGLGYKPGLIWMKRRDTAQEHALVNIVSGTLKHLYSDLTSAEQTTTNGVSSFNDDGWTMGANGLMNNTNNTYVGWAWKADDNEPTIFGEPAKAVYKFEDNANDVTGNYDATTATNITYSSSGKFNKAGVFNGSSTKVEFDGIGSLPTGTQKVSWSMWVHTDTGSQTCGLGGYGRWNTGGANAGGAQKYFGTGLSSGNLYFYGYYYNDGTSVALPTGQWNHLVYTFDGTNVKIYLNGSLEGTIARGSLDIGGGSGNLDLTIGKQAWNDSGEIFDGMIDQVRIYNGLLAQEQVDELYAETVSDNDDLTLGEPPKSIVSANANAGFSIVKWEGVGGTSKIPHGLSAAPELIINKRLSGSNSWDFWVTGATAIGWDKFLGLNRTDAAADGFNNTPFGDTAPTATVFTVDSDSGAGIGGSGDEFISYCFHSVTGYSKIGSYTGGGNTNPTINVGFAPDWLMVKKATGTTSGSKK